MIPLDGVQVLHTNQRCFLLLKRSFHLCYLTIVGFSLCAVFTIMLMQLIVNAAHILTPVILVLDYQAPKSQ